MGSGTVRGAYIHDTYLDEIKDPQFTLCAIDDKDEVEGRITPIHNSPPFIRVALETKEFFELRSIKKIA
jgi:hypothetical protein